jgi:beta-glucanase (GH16 family)
MKLPRGKGTWPAFWMLGENLFVEGWPRCGEIDIMEHGQDFDNLGAAIHTQAYNHTIGTQITGTYQINDYDTDFHTYGVVWNENELSFNVDGNTYFSVKKEDIGDSIEEWPFDQPFWIILNHAVGGSWGGTPDDSLYPHTVEVDWVRVYEDQQVTNTVNVETQEQISIFPNPAKDKIQIEWEGSPSNYQVKVTALDGALIMDERLSVDRSTLNISTLPAGAYFLSVFDGNDFMGSYKFVKE